MRRLLSLLLLGVVTSAMLATGPARGQTLRESLEDSEVGNRWTYDDWLSARAAAVQASKPIMALFR